MQKKQGRIAGIVIAAVLGVLASVPIGAPAQASDEHCGAWKTVMVSIQYRACTITKNGVLKGEGYFQNNHGSAVTITWQSGYSYSGGALQQVVGLSGPIPAGASTIKTPNPPIECAYSRLAVQVYDNNTSTWGAWSYDSERLWPGGC